MRAVLALLVLSSMLPGCTPYIPVKPGFGTSALVPRGGIPPEFDQFNNYDPAINSLLATQMCATPVEPLETDDIGAVPGGMVQERARCANHQPFLGIYQ